MAEADDNGEGGEFPLTDPGPTADEIVGVTMDDLFSIGTGEMPCADDRVRREAQTFVATHMRAQGYGYDAIRLEMGISIGWAWALVQRGLKKISKKTEETADTIRSLQKERLEKMLAGVMDRAVEGDSFAISSALQIMDRIDKLWGIEPPKVVEHTFTQELVNESRNSLFKALVAQHDERPDPGGTGEPPAKVH